MQECIKQRQTVRKMVCEVYFTSTLNVILGWCKKNGLQCVYCLHNKETGKRPHYHLVIWSYFSKRFRIDTLLSMSILGDITENLFYVCSDVKAYILYMTHQNECDKEAVYDWCDLKSIDTLSSRQIDVVMKNWYNNALEPSTVFNEIINVVKTGSITYFSALIEYVITEYGFEYYHKYKGEILLYWKSIYNTEKL